MKSTINFILILFVLSLSSQMAFGFGAATHTYLAHRLGSQYGITNLHEMYGAVTPDMFNLLFGYPYQDYLWNETHYEYIKVVDKAQLRVMKAFAFGFESHNEEYGADYSAHIRSAIGLGDGYVIVKRDILAPQLVPRLKRFLMNEGFPEYEAQLLAGQLAPAIADSAVESAIDYLVSQNEDPYVGIRMVMAAGTRSSLVPLLLFRAYVWDFAQQPGITFEEAAFVIFEAEEQFRQYMMLYGGVLSHADALDMMAEEGSRLAEIILEEEYGLSLTIPPRLMKRCLLAAIRVVKDDYSAELAATLAALEAK